VPDTSQEAAVTDPEKLVGEAESREAPNPRAIWCLELHMALAQVAATALAHRGGRKWFDVAGTRFSS
jgi:hypothetical protein